ncbi:MAG: hypothetical protein WCK86_07230 [Planctomycetia bacterium]
MKNSTVNQTADNSANRGGSTLVIVIALLGLLAFMGMLFYSFAAQERAASENFSEAAKFAVDEPPNVFDHMLRQVIVGPNDRPSDRTSILRSSTRRHSMVTNLVGSDIHPHTGEGVLLAEDGNGVPYVDQDGDQTADAVDWLEFVDSPIARPFVGYRERGLDGQTAPPAPDVDYTYPDINNLFLAYRGTAIRDNGPSPPPGTPRYEQVKVLIPSFHRPQYLKSVLGNGPNGNSVPTDNNWVSAFDGVNRNTAVYAGRSFRPHPQHIAGRLPDGTLVYRYVTNTEASALGLTGGFPFLPAEETNSGNGTAVRGEMGVWTGSHPDVYELDVDNDENGEGTKEGIWLDLNYPIQETSDGTKYAILHSVTIYDLDSLIDLNVHGNLAGLNRLGDLTQAGAGLVRDGQLSNQFVSRSNLGLGPNEINPLWAMRRPLIAGHSSGSQFVGHFGRAPANDLEASNMEWLWLLTGRGVFAANKLDNIFAGRWGEAERVYNTYKSGGSFNMADLPRPGRSGAAQEPGSNGVRFGGGYKGSGRNGFDDNQDRLEGEADLSQRRLRAFGTPMDYAGTGRTAAGIAADYNGSIFATVTNSPRAALLHHDPTASGPERWLRYYGYNINRGMTDTVPRYAFGQNGVFDQGNLASDDLVEDPFYDALFEDPLETVFDANYAQRQFDQVFSAGDLLSLHLHPDDKPEEMSERLSELAPFAFESIANNNVREKFTTLSNSLRRFMLRHDLGEDMLPNTVDDGPRAWEFNADTDGPSDNNGYGTGDRSSQDYANGYGEFPPAYGNGVGNGKPFSPTDPFRPQVRRLLTVEAGEGRELIGQLPLSLNHILDVERSSETPDEQSQPIQFLRYMRRAGLRFRPLTEHPSATEGTTVVGATSVPTYDPASHVVFPPVTPEQREFWARRDRQQLCRDVYVLLYTIGGAQRDSSNTAKIRNYLQTNDPNAAEGAALYTHQQLREMAQFAVNLVDAMDTDDVITKFEYDKNLGPDGSGAGGWNLDDDPYTMEVNAPGESDPNFSTVTDNGRHREDSVARGVVYGVEAQQVAFSEVLGVGAAMPAATSDHPATLYADETGRHHLFIELQNLSPMAVDLATSESTTMNNAVWRIVRHDRTSASDPMGGKNNGGNPFRAFAFLGKSSVNQTIPAGQRYSIAAASDSSVVSSDLYVDHNLDNTFDLIAPNAGGPALPTNTTNKTDQNAPELKPRCNLDLVHPDHNLAFLMVDQAGNQTSTVGAFLQTLQTYSGNTAMTNLRAGDFSMSGQEGFDLVLQRRANPNMPSLNHGAVAGEDANPWVDVDIINVEFRDLAINDGDMTTELQQNRLPGITSEERAEPLSDGSRALWAGAPPANLRYNTISRTNSSTTGGFTLWQAHFDRDYASSGELLSLPLCGPEKLTSMIGRLGDSPTLQATPAGATNPTPALLVAAASKFLRADFPNDNGQSIEVNRARDNRWYRLFQFVEVPSRVHRMLGNYVALDRVPGKLNLNTLRHWEVYAGLIDNPILLDRDPNPIGNNRFTVDRTLDQNGSPVNRDRWQEFLLSRDGGVTSSYDPVAGIAKNMLLPGTAKARPFRSPGYRKPMNGVVEGDNGQDATVLRTLRDDVLDSDVATNRHWLEVNDPQQHKNPRPTSLMHQHQVLSKIMNNTTTVSNTFIVYATAGYFEAVEHQVGGEGTGLYRIGSRIALDGSDPEKSQQRAVFIIDRTEAFKAYDPGSGDFDWKRLVKSSTMIE